jgi:putative sterol carrier protein
MQQRYLPKIIKKKSKYGNKKVTVSGKRFDSKKESQRYLELKSKVDRKEIQGLQTQVRFKIIINEILICTYIADFVYYDALGKRFVEDTKGFLTKEYKLKKKMMLAVHGIEIIES